MMRGRPWTTSGSTRRTKRYISLPPTREAEGAGPVPPVRGPARRRAAGRSGCSTLRTPWVEGSTGSGMKRTPFPGRERRDRPRVAPAHAAKHRLGADVPRQAGHEARQEEAHEAGIDARRHEGEVLAAGRAATGGGRSGPCCRPAPRPGTAPAPAARMGARGRAEHPSLKRACAFGPRGGPSGRTLPAGHLIRCSTRPRPAGWKVLPKCSAIQRRSSARVQAHTPSRAAAARSARRSIPGQARRLGPAEPVEGIRDGIWQGRGPAVPLPTRQRPQLPCRQIIPNAKHRAEGCPPPGAPDDQQPIAIEPSSRINPSARRQKIQPHELPS